MRIDSRALAAEAVGTFTLVFIGPGAAAVDSWSHGAVTHVGVSLAFAFVILALVYALGHVSGAHLNPAVTFGFWAAGRFPFRAVGPYVAAQLLGAVAAALALRAVVGGHVVAAATVPAIGSLPALLVETLLTFFLMVVILAVATDARVDGAVSGLAVGLTVGFNALMGGPLTGASMNPARSLGPAVVGGVWVGHWIYWIGPLLGAGGGALVYSYLRGERVERLA